MIDLDLLDEQLEQALTEEVRVLRGTPPPTQTYRAPAPAWLIEQDDGWSPTPPPVRARTSSPRTAAPRKRPPRPTPLPDPEAAVEAAPKPSTRKSRPAKRPAKAATTAKSAPRPPAAPEEAAAEPEVWFEPELDAPFEQELAWEPELALEADSNVEEDSDVEPGTGFEEDSDVEPAVGFEAGSDFEAAVGFEAESDLEAAVGFEAESDVGPEVAFAAECAVEPHGSFGPGSAFAPEDEFESEAGFERLAPYRLDPLDGADFGFDCEPDEVAAAAGVGEPGDDVDAELDAKRLAAADVVAQVDAGFEAEGEVDAATYFARLPQPPPPAIVSPPPDPVLSANGQARPAIVPPPDPVRNAKRAGTRPAATTPPDAPAPGVAPSRSPSPFARAAVGWEKPQVPEPAPAASSRPKAPAASSRPKAPAAPRRTATAPADRLIRLKVGSSNVARERLKRALSELAAEAKPEPGRPVERDPASQWAAMSEQLKPHFEPEPPLRFWG